MTIYHTNIAKDYALTAGFGSAWAGIREIIQNALDGHDKGHYMKVEHGKARDRSGDWALKVSNEGVTLTRDALVLGFSTKRHDSSARGQHGEGLVVGINALLNYGHEVWIRTGSEVWIAKHVTNDTGLEVLVIDIRPQPKNINDFIVEIKGVTPQDWASYQERLLFFGDKSDRRIGTSHGTMLMDPKYKNSLFVKGIYVAKLHGDYNFGYDLNVHLNRDREVADPWEMETKIQGVIMDACDKNLLKVEEVLAMLENESCGESRIFEYTKFYGYSGDFHKNVAEHFIEMHGENAIPVNSMGDSQRVEHFGKKGVVVSKSVKNIIEKHCGTLDDRLKQSALGKLKKYTWSELDHAERRNFTRAMQLVAAEEPWLTPDIVHIVDFVGESILGSMCRNAYGEVTEINLPKKILLDKSELLQSLIHEVAHKYGGDGETGHENRQLQIMANIIAKNLMP